MKKILIIVSLSLVTLLWIWATAYAANEGDKKEDVLGMNLNITTYTSEPCGIGGSSDPGAKTGEGQMSRYKCTISASNGFIQFIAGIYKYVYFISLVIGVLMIVYLGITMSISWVGGSEEMQGEAKKKIYEILFGLVALGLLPLILKTIAPFFFT